LSLAPRRIGSSRPAEEASNRVADVGGQTGVRPSCLATKSFQFSTTYQPDSRFWQIQGIETGILLIAAVTLIGIGAW
jgi:hypothetical protein